MSNPPTELHPDDRRQLSRVLGMKPAEIVAAVELPDADPPAAVVQTHDGQHVLVTSDQDGNPVVQPWDGRLPGAPVDGGEEVLVSEHGPELITGARVVDPNERANGQGDSDAVPVGTVEEVLAWVGEDKDRAARALVVERDSDKPRKSLVDQLKQRADQE